MKESITSDLLRESIVLEEKKRNDRLFAEWQKLERQQKNDVFAVVSGWMKNSTSSKEFNDAVENALRIF